MAVYIVLAIVGGYAAWKFLEGSPTIHSRREDAKTLIPLLERRGLFFASQVLDDFVENSSQDMAMERLKTLLRQFTDEDKATQEVIVPIFEANMEKILGNPRFRGALHSAINDGGYDLVELVPPGKK